MALVANYGPGPDDQDMLITKADMRALMEEVEEAMTSLTQLHAHIELLHAELPEQEEEVILFPGLSLAPTGWQPEWKQEFRNRLAHGPSAWRRLHKVIVYCDANDGYIDRETTQTILGRPAEHQFKRFCAPASTLVRDMVEEGTLPDTIVIPVQAVYSRGTTTAVGFRTNW